MGVKLHRPPQHEVLSITEKKESYVIYLAAPLLFFSSSISIQMFRDNPYHTRGVPIVGGYVMFSNDVDDNDVDDNDEDDNDVDDNVEDDSDVDDNV